MKHKQFVATIWEEQIIVKIFKFVFMKINFVTPLILTLNGDWKFVKKLDVFRAPWHSSVTIIRFQIRIIFISNKMQQWVVEVHTSIHTCMWVLYIRVGQKKLLKFLKFFFLRYRASIVRNDEIKFWFNLTKL